MAARFVLFCASGARPPAAITLDIDDTLDRVHGHQQLSLFNAHYDERCFLPIHIYEAGSGKPVAVILREGKTPGGSEVRAVIRHVTRHIRRHWPKTRICWRGDSHYARPAAPAPVASDSFPNPPPTGGCTPCAPPPPSARAGKPPSSRRCGFA